MEAPWTAAKSDDDLVYILQSTDPCWTRSIKRAAKAELNARTEARRMINT